MLHLILWGCTRASSRSPDILSRGEPPAWMLPSNCNPPLSYLDSKPDIFHVLEQVPRNICLPGDFEIEESSCRRPWGRTSQPPVCVSIALGCFWLPGALQEKSDWGSGASGGHFWFYVNKREAQKLRTINLHRLGLITCNFHFPKVRQVIIVMISDLVDMSMTPRTNYSWLWIHQIS